MITLDNHEWTELCDQVRLIDTELRAVKSADEWRTLTPAVRRLEGLVLALRAEMIAITAGAS